MGLRMPSLRTARRKGLFWGYFDETFRVISCDFGDNVALGITMGIIVEPVLGIWKAVFEKH